MKNRIDQHNTGKIKSTKIRCPLKLVYCEACLNKEDALHREKYLKSSWGKRYIKNRIKNQKMIFNELTQDCELNNLAICSFSILVFTDVSSVRLYNLINSRPSVAKQVQKIGQAISRGKDVSATMIYLHVLNKGTLAVTGLADFLGESYFLRSANPFTKLPTELKKCFKLS